MLSRQSNPWWTPGLAAGLVAGLFAVMMVGFFVPAYYGTDENGYVCASRRLALDGTAAKQTTHPLQHVSENVVQTDEATFYPKYPLGYPWLCAAAYRLGGPDAVFWVNPILATLAVLGMFFLGWALVNPFAGVVAAVLLATNPMHAQFGLASLSHAGATCFAVWGMVCLWHWGERGGRSLALLAGALLAYTYTIRYSEALLAMPALLMIVARYRSLPEGATPTERTVAVRRWRGEVAALAAGAFIAIAPLWVHHWVAFGAPWNTGYDLCGESTGFSWRWFQANWWTMLTRLNTPGLLLIFPLGLAGLVYVVAQHQRRGWLLAVWLAPAVLLYTAYYWAPTGDGRGYVRFFVSVFPALIVCAVALLCEMVPTRGARAVALGAFVTVVATFNLRETLPIMEQQTERLWQVHQTWEKVREHVPAGSVILAADQVLNHLEFVGDFELYSTSMFERRAIQNRVKILKDDDPHPMQRRKAEVLAKTVMPLSDAELATLQLSILTSNVAAGRLVYLITPADQLRTQRGRLGGRFHYEPVSEWLQTTGGQKNQPQSTSVALYHLKPRRPGERVGETTADIESRIDELQFQVRTMRGDFATEFPEANAKWTTINDTETEIRALQEKLARRRGTRAAPPMRSEKRDR